MNKLFLRDMVEDLWYEDLPPNFRKRAILGLNTSGDERANKKQKTRIPERATKSEHSRANKRKRRNETWTRGQLET